MSETDIFRPVKLEDVAGQKKAKLIVSKMIETGRISSMIFYGPSGCGKTTIANIVAGTFQMPLYKIDGTVFSTAEFKKIMNEQEKLGKTIMVYLDEIQYLTQKQQQLFLNPVETGKIILIAATADSPYHKVYKALLSRCVVVEFVGLSKQENIENLHRIANIAGRTGDFEDSALEHIAKMAGGDARSAVKIFRLINDIYPTGKVDEETVKNVTPANQPIAYDGEDTYYDLLGCLQKSIRGSDIDAALLYLAKMLNNGDMLAVIRRLQVIASEDVGMANPNVPMVVRACCESAVELGMPEARIPLHHAVALMALSPKSNSVHEAYARAEEDIKNGMGVQIPVHLQAPLFKGYKYPHSYPNNWVPQQYMPNDLVGKKYYQPGNNQMENNLKNYWENIKKSGH